jgi:hypothetical protein
VRVLQLRDQQDLTSEPLGAHTRGQLRKQDFDDDRATERGLLRHEDPRHTATAELTLEGALIAQRALELLAEIG